VNVSDLIGQRVTEVRHTLYHHSLNTFIIIIIIIIIFQSPMGRRRAMDSLHHYSTLFRDGRLHLRRRFADDDDEFVRAVIIKRNPPKEVE